MPPPPHPALPKPAKHQHRPTWDPWNSSSTGHQRAESSTGTGWRESRSHKLNSQFQSGGSGGKRIDDACAPRSKRWDLEEEKERMLAEMPSALRDRLVRPPSVMEMLTKPGVMRESLVKSSGGKDVSLTGPMSDEDVAEQRRKEDEVKDAEARERGIFQGVVVYVNGSTFPLISDLKLKQIITESGGQISLHLGRRKVTHVILGRPAGNGQGFGGGLAGGKLEKEIKKVGGCGVKFVGVEWILESLKSGKRLPEARFSNMKIAAKGQGSVYGFYSNQGGSAARA